MVRLLISITMQLIASALGLAVAALLLDGVTINSSGFIVAVLVFAASTFIFEPLVLKLSVQYLPALRGGIALFSTLVSLLVTATFTEGLAINGLDAWILAPFIVWITVVAAGILLPLVVFKRLLQKHSDSKKETV